MMQIENGQDVGDWQNFNSLFLVRVFKQINVCMKKMYVYLKIKNKNKLRNRFLKTQGHGLRSVLVQTGSIFLSHSASRSIMMIDNRNIIVVV